MDSKGPGHTVLCTDGLVPFFTFAVLFLYPRHTKYVGVYSFRFSVRPFVRSYVHSFVRSFVHTFIRLSVTGSKFLR